MITGHRKVLLARWTVLAGLAALWEAGAHWFGWVASISSPGEIWHAAFSVILADSAVAAAPWPSPLPLASA